MATVNGKSNFIQHGVWQSVWTMGNADTGTPDELSRFPYHSITIAGTFGGATVKVEGSDDGTNYFTLKDIGATAVTTTIAARYDVLDVPRFIRPVSTGGGGTSVVVTITSRSLGNG